MSFVRLPYIHEFVDRHGKQRRYYRRKGLKQVPLPAWLDLGSPQFMEAYQSAHNRGAYLEVGVTRSRSGTIGALVSAYLNSPAFKNLALETQRSRRGILERFRDEHGDKRVETLERRHVQMMLNAKAATPSAARNFLNTLRALLEFAVECGIRADNPVLGVKRPKIRTTGFRTWTEEDILAFEGKHPAGSQARLAMALMLHTGQRRSDIVHMGRQHVRNGAIEVRQRKTGTVLTIPIHDELQKMIDATPSKNNLPFLTTSQGKPFTSAASFGNWFSERCREAGLPKGTAAHGFRKAACRRLAEAGCSASEIMSVSGHKSLSEVQRYCAAADQVRLARAAQAKARRSETETKTSSGKP
jgi:integrase